MPFAEDVVQESLLRLWRKPDILEQPSESARAWLFTVARNLVIDDRRSARYTRELQSDNLPERPSLDAIGPAVDKWVLADALKSLSSTTATRSCAPITSARPWPISPSRNGFPRARSNPDSTTRCARYELRCRKGGLAVTDQQTRTTTSPSGTPLTSSAR